MAAFRYSDDFFALQLSLANRATALTGAPLAHCVQDFTAFYGCFGLGPSPDAEHPLWIEYMRGLEKAADPLAWTVQTYDALQEKFPAQEHYWGCFAYNLHFNDPTVIRPHFANNDDSGHGVLSSARKTIRLAELTAMFAEIQRAAPQARTVRGESWLYNHSGYTRLFPPEFGASEFAVTQEQAAFKYRAIWGQMVDSEGEVRPETAALFHRELAGALNVDQFHRCFPYRILRTECAIDLFYRFYGLA